MTSAWAFALAAWERPGVAAICLGLQNEHGQCPALLLWRCWTLEEQRSVDPESLARAVEIARAWEEQVLRPLRGLRERLASPALALAEVGHAAVRRRVTDAELEAEHALLDTLAAIEGAEAPIGAIPALQALVDLAEAWRSPAPAAALARLSDALREAL